MRALLTIGAAMATLALAVAPGAEAGSAMPHVHAAPPPVMATGSDEGMILVQSGPDFLVVSGVPSGDTLSIRAGAGTGYRTLARAPNGVVLRNLGCGSGWCQVETRDGSVRGYASQRFLRESSGSGGGSGSGSSNDVPELSVRNSGEIEVRWRSGCTVLYNARGDRLQAGGSCSRSQRSRSDDAVERYLREQGGSSAEGGGGPFDMRGIGLVTLGGPLVGRITSRNGRVFALILTATRDGFTCTGSFDERPGTRTVMSTFITCTNGARGSAVLRNNTVTFSAGGKGGYVRFR